MVPSTSKKKEEEGGMRKKEKERAGGKKNLKEGSDGEGVKFRGTIAVSSHFIQLPFKSTRFGKMGGS